MIDTPQYAIHSSSLKVKYNMHCDTAQDTMNATPHKWRYELLSYIVFQLAGRLCRYTSTQVGRQAGNMYMTISYHTISMGCWNSNTQLWLKSMVCVIGGMYALHKCQHMADKANMYTHGRISTTAGYFIHMTLYAALNKEQLSRSPLQSNN